MKRIWRYIVWTPPLLVAAWLVLLSGCALIDPGGSSARAVRQYKEYSWTADGDFSVLGEGAQTERFTLASGNVVLKLDSDGRPVIDPEASTLEYYLTSEPSADGAVSALVAMAQISIEQGRATQQAYSDTLTALIDLLSAFLAARSQPATTQPH